MPELPTPRLILETLLPHLKVAAAYAHQIQTRIAALPEKEQAENLFAAALTDADLSIQTCIEVALLGSFPQIRFYGEEHEQAFNTKYFRAIDLGPQDDYLVTLDPIDGTRFYLDGHANYQIILGVLNRDDFEAVIAISPAQNTYYYALRGQGVFKGSLAAGLDDCHPVQMGPTQNTVLLGSKLSALAASLNQHYDVIDISTAYSKTAQIPNFNGILSGDLTGAALAKGKFIDGAALAFIAKEAGCIVTTFDGTPPPPLHACKDYERPGLIVASSTQVHQHLLEAVQSQSGQLATSVAVF
ncbi:MAG: inositol monophosphatase family protein [Cyanothece sp. SIO1E1]|nr:inositol monophosphatase family protein [Cyanothece sp. SIO1E1]